MLQQRSRQHCTTWRCCQLLLVPMLLLLLQFQLHWLWIAAHATQWQAAH
jgi:hypothetical protein